MCLGSVCWLNAQTPVDIHVSDVVWHNNEQCLLYAKDAKDQVGLGLFKVGDYDGQILTRYPKKTRFDISWFEKQEQALVIARYEKKIADRDARCVDILLVNARNGAIKTLKSDDNILSAVVDLSPKLRHGVISVWTSTEIQKYALCENDDKLVRANEFEQLVMNSKASSLIRWTPQGTAVFAATNCSMDPSTSLLTIMSNGKAYYCRLDPIADPQVLASQALVIGEKFFTLVRSSNQMQILVEPATGERAFEMTPTNASMHPITIRELAPRDEEDYPDWTIVSGLLKKGNATAQVTGTWTGNDTKEQPKFVAAQAKNTWLSPKGNNAAYLIDGALFVKKL
jgi:hypothetical protein